MEEAEELCSEIALLREGQLVAHQPTSQLTQSLRLARPITLTARRREASVEGAVWRASSKPCQVSLRWRR